MGDKYHNLGDKLLPMSEKSSTFAPDLKITLTPYTLTPYTLHNMAQVSLVKGLGIASISGKLGNCIFYTRNGKQYVKRADKNNDDLPSIIESISGNHV